MRAGPGPRAREEFAPRGVAPRIFPSFLRRLQPVAGCGWRLRVLLCSGPRVIHPFDGLAHPRLDIAHEAREVAFPAPHGLEPRFPMPGHGRAPHIRMNACHQPDAALRGPQVAGLALRIAPCDQGLDDRGPGGGRAEPALAHGRGEFPLFELTAGGLHGGEQGGLVEAPGRSRLLLERAGLHHSLPLVPGEIRGQGGLRAGIGAAARGRRALPRPFGLRIQNPPAGPIDPGAEALEEVDHRRCGRSRANGGDYAGGRVEVVGVPGRQQPCADQIVDPGFGRVQTAGRGIAGGGNERVMIADPRVVDEAFAEGPFATALGDFFGRETLAGHLHHPGQLGRHIPGEVAAVGAGIADEFMALVEGLGGLEGLLGRVAVEAVGVALQLRQIVEEGGREFSLLALDGLDAGLAAPAALGDLLGEPALGGKPPGPLSPRRRLLGRAFGGSAGLAGLGLGIGSGLGFGREPMAAIASDPRLICAGSRFVGLEGRHHLLVALGPEVANRLLPFRQHGQGRGLYAAHREEFALGASPAPGDRVGAREIHSHQPVGSAARPGGVRQGVEFRGRPQVLHASPNGLLGEGRDPEAFDGFLAAGLLVDVAKDQFSLAAGIRGADHGVQPRIAEQP